MNGAYLHLVMNHVPVVGMPLSFLLLLAGVVRKSKELTQAGLVALILMGLITIPVFKTGGPAARVLHNTPGATIERGAIHEHAEAADYAFTASAILGVLALIAFVWGCRSESVPMVLSVIVLLGALATSVIMGRVAHLGGLIRHPEISNAPAPAGAPAAETPAPTAPPAH